MAEVRKYFCCTDNLTGCKIIGGIQIALNAILLIFSVVFNVVLANHQQPNTGLIAFIAIFLAVLLGLELLWVEGDLPVEILPEGILSPEISPTGTLPYGIFPEIWTGNLPEVIFPEILIGNLPEVFFPEILIGNLPTGTSPVCRRFPRT